MRALLVACLPLLFVFSLAPIAAADDEDTGTPTWSDPQGVPTSSSVRATDPAAASTYTNANTNTNTASVTTPRLRPPQVIYAPKLQPRVERTAETPAAATVPAAEGNAGETEVAKPFVMPTRSTVISIRKTHNQPWHGNWKALELDMLLAVVGQSGQHVGATVSFFETQNGQPLRAAMQPYVDGEGNVCVYTKLVPIQSGSRLFRSRLLIPYRAFPWPTKGPAYGVEARVRLMRRDAAGNFAVLAREETSFTVHFERDAACGTGAKDRQPCGTPTARALRYEWGMMWSEESGPTLSQAGLSPPKGPGPRRDWYQWRWRTRGGLVDRKEAKWAAE